MSHAVSEKVNNQKVAGRIHTVYLRVSACIRLFERLLTVYLRVRLLADLA